MTVGGNVVGRRDLQWAGLLRGLRASITWSALVLLLWPGGLELSATGTYLAVRRVIRDIARLQALNRADR